MKNTVIIPGKLEATKLGKKRKDKAFYITDLPETPTQQDMDRAAIIVLNTSFPLYKKVKTEFIKVCNLNTETLEEYINYLDSKTDGAPETILMVGAARTELHRRRAAQSLGKHEA